MLADDPLKGLSIWNIFHWLDDQPTVSVSVLKSHSGAVITIKSEFYQFMYT